MDSEPQAATGPTSATGPDRTPLRRRTDRRVLAGVAAGVADHLGWDVALVRLLFVLATVLTQGFGLLAYLVAALVIPSADDPTDAAPSRAVDRRGSMFWVGVALVVVGAVWLMGSAPLRFGVLPVVSVGELALPLLLIAFGLALWVSAPDPSTRPELTMDTSTDHPADQAPPGASTPPPPPQDVTATGPDDPPPPAPGGSLLARISVGVILVTVGALWSLRLAGVLAITVGQILAVVLLLIGVSLLIGAVVGRTRSLIWVGAVLLPLVIIAQLPGPSGLVALTDQAVDGDAAGELRLAPTSVEALADDYQLGVGSLRLDLTEVPFDDEQLSIDVQVGIGEVRVTVPDDVAVQVTGSAGIGSVRLDERRAGGLGVGELEYRNDPPDARAELELRLRAGIGEVRLIEEPAGQR